MELIQFGRDKVIAGKNDKVKCWYIIKQGAVLQKTEMSEMKLEPHYIIGLSEKDIYQCTYTAIEDTTLIVLNCLNADELGKLIAGQERARNIFLRAALVQRHQLLCLYSEISNKARQFRILGQTLYDEYKTLCTKYKIEMQNFSKRIEHAKPLIVTHKAERWEINTSISIMKNYLQDYIQLMRRDDNLTVGEIMDISEQMHRFMLGILEMENYLLYNKDIMLSENGSDLFKLYFDLAIDMYDKKYPTDICLERARRIADFARKLNLYNPRLINRRLKEFEEYDYAGGDALACEDGNVRKVRREMDVVNEHGISHILEYAGYSDDETDKISDMIESYFKLPDMYATDKKTHSLRKNVGKVFYEIYLKVFLRAVNDESTLTPLLEMFLNFGFMDVSFIGPDRTRELYDLCAHLDICHSKNIYTIYEWLKLIYNGQKDTSKNEFDCNFVAYQNSLYKEKRISKEEMEANLKNNEMRLEFEIQNMFMTTNKLTYGRISTFCPVLSGADLINSVEKMLVTADALENALNEIRKIDYSIFYRETMFSDTESGIANDRLMKEVLPDIILLPNAGTRAMMWQETANVKSDTQARFMFPIFTASDVPDMMLTCIGQFRWEICRKIEGVRWNDLREKSLTAEYCNYLQFYRKNRNLSTESKEKIKSTLQSAKNNYREVFARDYINWIKFEAKGAYRLNKVARDILVRYCPFAKPIRRELANNPLYQMSLAVYENGQEKQRQHYAALINKYDKSRYMPEMRETLQFYEM